MGSLTSAVMNAGAAPFNIDSNINLQEDKTLKGLELPQNAEAQAQNKNMLQTQEEVQAVKQQAIDTVVQQAEQGVITPKEAVELVQRVNAAAEQDAQAVQAAQKKVRNAEDLPDVTEQNGELHVGAITTIKNPYAGEKPVVTNKKTDTNITIPLENVITASEVMKMAEEEAAKGNAGYKSNVKKNLKKNFQKLFGGRSVTVNNVEFQNKKYDVTLNSGVIEKLVSTGKESAEKYAVLGSIEEIVKNGEYVGSGVALNKNNVIRYDYFETKAKINGERYIVSFDVEVIPGTNKYRTHKIVNKMSLTQQGVESGKKPLAPSNASSSSVNIPQPVQKSNGNNFTENAMPEKQTFEVQRTEKSKKVQGMAEKAFLTNATKNMGVRQSTRRNTLAPIAHKLAEEIRKTGKASEETRSRLFEESYKNGIVEDNAFYEQYKGIKDELRTTTLQFKDANNNKPEWKALRKESFGLLRLSSMGKCHGRGCKRFRALCIVAGPVCALNGLGRRNINCVYFGLSCQ